MNSQRYALQTVKAMAQLVAATAAVTVTASLQGLLVWLLQRGACVEGGTGRALHEDKSVGLRLRAICSQS